MSDLKKGDDEFISCHVYGFVIVSAFIVTAAVRASALPVIVAPLLMVTDAEAMIVPWNLAVVSMVAELPTIQKMFLA